MNAYINAGFLFCRFKRKWERIRNVIKVEQLRLDINNKPTDGGDFEQILKTCVVKEFSNTKWLMNNKNK